MKDLLNPASTDSMPTVKSWLNNGKSALSVAETFYHEQHREILPVLTEQNVLMQLAHLRTHPSVAGAMARKQLTVSGWIYDIASGEVRIAENGSDEFVALSAASSSAAR
jgi:carbonic anhydrase